MNITEFNIAYFDENVDVDARVVIFPWSERLERAVLKRNPEFENFAQACVYLFNVGCSDVDEQDCVKLKGESSNLLDAIQYFNKISY